MVLHSGIKRCVNWGAFMVPGLALWLPSGYSYGAVVLLVAALVSTPLWWERPIPRVGWWMAAMFFAMATLFLLDVDVAEGLKGLDRPSKYLLALPCLFFVLSFEPSCRWLWLGITMGAGGAGLLALYETQVLCWPRATGFTNAIQYGNLSLLLGLMASLLLVVQWRRWLLWQRLAIGTAFVLGLAGSLLSQSRGGWLALGLVLPLCTWLLVRLGQHRVLWSAGALVLAVYALLQTPAVHQRIEEAFHEAQTYQRNGDGATSIGHRLAHWRLAWEMGIDRPWVGWGLAGYEAEKVRRVAQGQAHPMVLQFSHAHNEILDQFAKRGLLGVLILMVFYGVPLIIFWPLSRRTMDQQGKTDEESLTLCLVGVLLPVAYFGFGLTQVFLAHNSGNIFYLFMCLLVLGTLHGRRTRISSESF